MPIIHDKTPPPHGYDPSEDFTKEQLHRYTEKANEAERKQELQHELNMLEEKRLKRLSLLRRAKLIALRRARRSRNPASPLKRFLLWFSVFCLLCIGFVYMLKP
ncbi:hypothetical protein [Vibrio tritonius]|uniref:hypothetical protein n=1 Tax=Vibrio tritonius TaxID=1435069 RepID=UPI00315CAAF3